MYRHADDSAHDLPDAQTRAAMLAAGRERGMEASYVRLEGILSQSPQLPLNAGVSHWMQVGPFLQKPVPQYNQVR
jgi:hypothetical protein